MKSLALASAITMALAGAVAAQSQTIYKPGDPGVRNPQVVVEKKPSYTAAAMRQQIQGSVKLEAVIDAEGKPTNIRVVQSLDPTYGLDANAVSALEGWRFKPATKDGKPVPVLVKVEMTFTLRDAIVYKAGDPGVKSPIVIKDVKPAYTAAARRAAIQGVVELECVIGLDGIPREIKVTRSLDKIHGTDQQALEALEQWRFEPAMLDGKPVPMRVTIEMSFALRDRK